MGLARPPRPPTKTSTKPASEGSRLSEVARHLVLPKGIVTTGWPKVRETCVELKISFEGWQDGLGRAMLGKGADGLYAADAIVGSIPRQVGKTFLIGSTVFALCIATPGTLVLWTAHRYVTANDTFNDLKAIAERPELKPHIRKVTTATNNQAIEFRNGSKILFGARERGFGRGFKRVAIIVFDEAQILTENAIDDMVPAANRHPNPLIFYIGTPPKPSDPGDVFTNLRREALEGDSEDVLYVEFSADEDANPLDREQWAKANPSYPAHTSARAMMRMKKNLSPASFLREAMGIWDGTATVGVFTSGSWARGLVVGPEPGPVALGIAADPDLTWLSLGAASPKADEARQQHVGSVMRVRDDLQRALFISEVKRIQTERNVIVAIDPKGPAAPLITELEAAQVTLLQLGTDDFIQACADMRAGVESGGIVHGAYTDLDAAVDAAGWRKVGDRRVFARQGGEIAALEAVAIAAWAAGQAAAFEMYGAEDLDQCDQCKAKPHEDPDGEHDYLCPDCREA